MATAGTTGSFGRFACFLTLQLQECRNNPSESPGQRCEKPCCRFEITVLGVSWANATQWHCKSCGRRSIFFYISEVFTTILYHLTCCCNILQLHVTAMWMNIEKKRLLICNNRTTYGQLVKAIIPVTSRQCATMNDSSLSLNSDWCQESLQTSQCTLQTR